MHFPGGQNVVATFQFQGKMLVYGAQHRIKRKVEGLPSPPDKDGVICYEPVHEDEVTWKQLYALFCGHHL